MKKCFMFTLSFVLIAVMASCAFAVVYGKTGYEDHGDTADDPWEIDSAAVLAKVRDDINSGAINFTAYYKLTADIDLTDPQYSDWEPIGIEEQYSTPHNFNGYFDGNYHTIKIKMVRRLKRHAALFGYVGSGTIRNLAVEGSITQSSNEYHGNETGGIVAILKRGTIDNCRFNGTISATKTYERGDERVGGIVGAIDGSGIVEITNCKVGSVSETRLTGTGSSSNAPAVGGIVGLYRDYHPQDKLTGNYVRVILNEDADHGNVYGVREMNQGSRGTVSGNTEIDPDDDTEPYDSRAFDTPSDDPKKEDTDPSPKPEDGDTTEGDPTEDETGKGTPPGKDIDDDDTSGDGTGPDTSQNSTNTGETINNPQAQSNINIGGGGGGCDTGFGFVGVILAGMYLLRKKS